MSDYPYFTGKMDDWYEFKDQFEGTAQGQGMGWILKEYKEMTLLLQVQHSSSILHLFIQY